MSPYVTFVMQIRFSKSLLATSCLLIIQFHAAVHVILAQNDRRNLPQGRGGAVGMGYLFLEKGA